MDARLACRVAPFLAALLVLQVGAVWAASEVPLITIELSGDEGVAFVGRCEAKSDKGTVAFDLKGAVPYVHRIRVHGVSCRFMKRSEGGLLTIEVRKNGQSRSRSTVSGSSGQVNISVY